MSAMAVIAGVALVLHVVLSSAVGWTVMISFGMNAATRNDYPYMFSNDSIVQRLVMELTPLLVLCIIINTVQPVLSGMAIGAGWRTAVVYVNIACYYLFGVVPLGLALGFVLQMGVKGIWCGMLLGTVVQTCVIFGMIYKINWNKEASIAEERIKKWGGDIDPQGDEYAVILQATHNNNNINRTTSLPNLFLSGSGHQLSLNNGLILGQDTFPQHLKVTELGHVDHRGCIVAGLCFHVLWDERPELVDVHGGAVELVPELVEDPHTDFLEIPIMVLVEEDPVVVHTSTFPRPPACLQFCLIRPWSALPSRASCGSS
ncbi:copper amine oxidase 1-like [Hibiscus syriacus]|uniref:Copper amine oxidase 1-like n=1 Tax=Hibiscus syriacus TaxID=106335 RepID=A0A6A3BJ68_HIBSY|nr:copper amine oxidase 1-like [Hibiscus syriacus]